jgi:competence protein ComGC
MKRAFTLRELFCVIGVLLLLLAVLPLFKQREDASQASCRSNLKQISMALLLYAQDYDNRLPDRSHVDSLPFLLDPYLKNRHLWRCPTDTNKDNTFDTTPTDRTLSYGYNWLGLTRDGPSLRLEVQNQQDTLSFLESTGPYATPADLLWMGGSGPVYRHPTGHSPGAYAAWLDGRVSRVSPDQIEAKVERSPGAPWSIEQYRYWRLKQ